MAINQIGHLNFAIIKGVPPILRSSVEVIARPNVQGIALRNIGYRAAPFRATTMEDVDSLEAGRQVLSAYATLIDSDPVPIIVNDVDYLMTEGLLFAILSVEPIRVAKAAEVVGGILPASTAGAVVYASWNIVPVEA